MPLLSLRRQTLLFGAFWAGLAVALGAFAAHALKTRLSPEMLSIFETGVRYQIYHALALLVIAGHIPENRPPALLSTTIWLFHLGIFLFSGSLYILSLSGIRAWGMVTPLGGVSFLTAWLLFILFLLKS